jgi:uncharacterized membrane protein (Fun14 family)
MPDGMSDTRAMQTAGDAGSLPERVGRSLWSALFGSKLFILALLATALGGGLWIRDAMRPAPPAPSPAAPLAGSFAAGGGPAAPSIAEPSRAPLAFRIGASFMGGCFLGWLLRRFIKLTLLIGGAAVIGLAILKATGMIQFDWDGLGRSVHDGVDAAQQQAGALKDSILAALPSGGSALAGLFIGVRRG